MQKPSFAVEYMIGGREGKEDFSKQVPIEYNGQVTWVSKLYVRIRAKKAQSEESGEITRG